MPVIWSVNERVTLRLLSWPDGDDCLCCNEATSDIYTIGLFGKLILGIICEGDITEPALYKAVGHALGSDLDDAQRHAVDHHLFSFKALDLIQSSE